MRVDGITLIEGSDASNLTIKAGTDFPVQPNEGELFLKTGSASGLYVYQSSTWGKIAKSDEFSNLATVATTGSYNDLTDKPTSQFEYTLPPATTTVLGGVKDGAGVSVALDGTLSADVTSVAGRTGDVVLTKSDVGLANVDNTADSVKLVASAASFTTARLINGVSFNGTADITVADSTKLPLAGGTMTGAITFAAGQTWPTFNQNTTGSAATLTTGRTIGMTGDVTWTSASFNGSANVTGTATLANSGVTAGTYKSVTVDSKGRVTAGTNPTTLSGYGITDAQALDADLTAIAALAGTSGLLKKTAANTWSLDTSAYITGNQSITFSGDVTGSGATAVTLTLANSGVTAGTYTSVTVDAKGRVTAATNPTTLSGYGITDAVSSSLIGAVNGVASLGADGKVPSAQLPSYVDDVVEYSNQASFPVTGEVSKIYVALDVNKIFRWSGTAYVEISPTAGNADTATKLATARTISLTGDVTGSVLFDGSADASITATIAANSVALGTDTTGNYVASVATTAPLSGGAVGSEGGALTLSLAAGYGDTQNPYASKTANYILAAPNGAAGAPTFRAIVAADIPTLNQNTTGSAATLTTGRTIGMTGDVTWTSASFNGSANVTGTATLANSGVTAGTYKSVTVDAKGRVTAGTNPTTLSGYGITDAQPLDADLTAIAALAGTSGLLKKTAADTWSLDTNAYLTANQSITFSGDATGSGTTAVALTLANSGVTAGTYPKVTVDAKGRVTAGASLSASDIPALTLENLPDSWAKRAVRVATTANLTLSGTQTIDGIAVVVGDRVLVKNQTTAAQNGIYIVSAGAWTRATDADASSELSAAVVAVDLGTANGGEIWSTTFKSSDTVGTTAMNWYQVMFNNGTWAISTTGSAATLTTGRTIGMTGDVTWTSASFNGSANVTGTATLANSGVTAGTYPKVTVDAKGRVTAGTTLAATDIPALDASVITSGTLDAARLPAITATSAASVLTTNWSFSEDTDGTLVFKYLGSPRARLTTDGTFAAYTLDANVDLVNGEIPL